MSGENKNLEELFKKNREDIKRHIGVLLENMDDRFDAVAEDLKIIKQDVGYLKEDMDYVKSEIVEIKDRFKEVDAVEKSHENRIVKLENTVLAKA